jgi:hypothetical protein
MLDLATGPEFRLRFERETRAISSLEQRAEHLYRDVAFQAGVAAAIDVTHAAGAERGDDLVWS